MMVFRSDNKVYRGTAIEIVLALECDAKNYPHRGQPMRKFLTWSLKKLESHIPPQDMHLSKRINAEELAFSYLCLRDEYGAGELLASMHDQAGTPFPRSLDEHQGA
jgi:hypothetical protein